MLNTKHLTTDFSRYEGDLNANEKCVKNFCFRFVKQSVLTNKCLFISPETLQRGRPDLLKHLQRSRKTHAGGDDEIAPTAKKPKLILCNDTVSHGEEAVMGKFSDLAKRTTESELAIKNLQQENATLTFALQKIQQQDEIKTRQLLQLEEQIRVMDLQMTQAFQQLQAQVAQNGLAANVHFIQDCPEVQAILPGFQLGLHTSLKESGPLVLLEYLAQGLPFLAYATGAVAALIRPEFPEYFMDHFDPEQWQKRITQLLHSQPDTDKMERVLKAHFSPQQYSEKCLKFYQKILENEAC